jgi:hypothetical protein
MHSIFAAMQKFISFILLITLFLQVMPLHQLSKYISKASRESMLETNEDEASTSSAFFLKKVEKQTEFLQIHLFNVFMYGGFINNRFTLMQENFIAVISKEIIVPPPDTFV